MLRLAGVDVPSIAAALLGRLWVVDEERPNRVALDTLGQNLVGVAVKVKIQTANSDKPAL